MTKKPNPFCHNAFLTTILHLAPLLAFTGYRGDHLLAVSLAVWVGLSISADMANKRLARSSQAALLAGPPTRGSHSSGLRATHIKSGEVLGAPFTGSFRGLKSFTCWFSGRRRGVQPWQWPLLCFSEIPRQAGCGQTPLSTHSLRPQGKRENRRIGSLP